LVERQKRLSAEVRRLCDELEVAAESGLARPLVVEKEYLLAMRRAERDWLVTLSRRITESAAFIKPWRAWRVQMMGQSAKSRRGGARRG